MSNSFTPMQPSLQFPSEILEFGDDKQLSSSLVQQFDAATTHLNTWLSSQAEAEKDAACRQIKGFLVSLNVYSRLPLGFRLQVLDELANVYETCDADLILAMLTSYQQALVHLPDDYARYRPPIVTHALNLIISFYYHCLHAHKVLDTRVIDRAMHLAGTEFHADGDQEDASMTELKRAISRHEFIRKLDFFGQSREVQKHLWLDVHRLAEKVDPQCFGAGQPLPQMEGNAFLVSNLLTPSVRPLVVANLPKNYAYKIWIFPVQPLINSLHQAKRQHKALLEGLDSSSIEHKHGLASAECFLEALSQSGRDQSRENTDGLHVALEWKADDAISACLGNRPTRNRDNILWTISDVHELGAGLECEGADAVKAEINALVGIKWSDNAEDRPRLGFLRWHHTKEQGGCRLGIKFFDREAEVKQCIMTGSDPMRRVIPILIPTKEMGKVAIFPLPNLVPGTTFQLLDRGERKELRIGDVLATGPNYVLCFIETTESR